MGAKVLTQLLRIGPIALGILMAIAFPQPTRAGILGLWQPSAPEANETDPLPAVPPLGDPRLYLPQPAPLSPPVFPKSAPKTRTFTIPARYYGAIVNRVYPRQGERVIALTFDDGPWPDTEKVLEVLRRHGVRATFFFLGQNLPLYPEIARQVVTDGHAVGNHTWNHPYHALDGATAALEINDTARHIAELTGTPLLIFRPPGGILDNGAADYARRKNYVVVMWSIDTQDYQQPPAATLADRVLTQAHPGAIVLMHDGGGNRSRTVEALATIIAGLKAQGYRFVTVPELLEMDSESP
ncbi:MAG: polysaccharide deacetylase family protein [Limnospira sp.]